MAQPGQRIGEFVLDAKVGQGAFGEVWRARHHVWADQLAAIKIPTDPQYLRNLQREGVAIHGLRHSNIVRALAFDPYADPPYLATEYVPGSSLRPLIAEGPLKVDEAVAILRHVLAGLGEAHRNGLVHRDVKPENILIHEGARARRFTGEGDVKVTDFGLGRASELQASSIVHSASLNDPAGRELAGTLDYMAPEQRSAGAAIDGRADLYACGVVLYEMLTGEKPAGTDVPSDVNKAIPKYLDDVFRCSYARIEKRFASAAAFAAALAPPAATGLPLPAFAASHRRCPVCRAVAEATDQFCTQCGVQIVEKIRRCGQCGAYPDADDQFCILCGTSLNARGAANATLA